MSFKHEDTELLRSPSAGTSCSAMAKGVVDCSHRGLTAVPKNIPKSVRILILSHNKISKVEPDAFTGLTELRVLYLGYNTISSKSIVMELFRDLGRLEELYLDHNQVNKYSENCFSYLGKVRILDLSYMNNGIKKPFAAAVFEPLKSLVDLRLNGDLLPSFNILPQGSLPKLQRLALAGNGIERIEKDDFSYLHNANIDDLDLSQNALSTIDPSCFKGITLLKFLDLRHSLRSEDVISELGTALKNVHVTNITLSMVGLTNLNDSTFETFGDVQLKALDLSLNNISLIEGTPFQYFSHLEELNLYKNNISVIGPNAFSQLPSLKTLDLSNNSLTSINNTTLQSLNGSVLEVIYLELNRIETIHPGSFRGLGQLRYLKLSKNQIKQKFMGPEFEGMPKLEFLDLALNKEISLDNDAFANVTALRKLYLNVIGMKSMMSGKSPFRHLVKLQTLDLSNNSMSRILAPDVFKSLTKLQVLYLQHNNLYHLWEDPTPIVYFLSGLTSLQKADLSYNGFHMIPDGTFNSTTNLQTLLLARNQISNFTASTFDGLRHLQKLEIHHNKLKVIEEESFRPFLNSLQSLSISDNPWLCDCQLEWFRKWINDTRAVIPDLGKTECDNPRGTALLDYWPSPYDCDGKLRPRVYYIIGGSVLLVLLLLMLLWRCRWSIRYCVLRGRARQRYRRRDGYNLIPGSNSSYESDVFISYSSRDEEWVNETLRPQLVGEEGDPERFNVSVHDESFVAGETIADNIIETIGRSRKTLCVISKNYLNSNWCKYEHEVAMFKHLGEKKCLILIRLDDVSDNDVKQHDRIHQVMRQETYLKWPGDRAPQMEKKVFWEKLREAVTEIEETRCGGCCCCC